MRRAEARGPRPWSTTSSPTTGVKSIFTTNEQTRHSDEYFLTSGDKIRFFFEEEAFDADGELRQAKALSINKLGHAMHDLDPVFDALQPHPALAELCADLGYEDPALLQSMYIFKQPRIGGEVDLPHRPTFLWTEPRSRHRLLVRHRGRDAWRTAACGPCPAARASR